MSTHQIKALTLSFTLLLSTALGGGSGAPQGTAAQGVRIQNVTASSRIDPQALDRFMAREMKNYSVPGVGLAIVENSKIVYARGYGFKDLATRAPADANTQFAIGSVTKSFTSLGIMRLVDQGLVKLDTPVIKYLPEFKLKDPVSTRTVTVRHLLTHTSGLTRDDTGFEDPAYSIAKIMADAARTLLVGKPGAVYVYSNVNAILAGEIIHRVSGKSWEAFTRDEILKPLGMLDTNFTQAAMQRTGNFATPYALDLLTGLKPAPFYALGTRSPAGAVNGSPADMAKYIQFQVGDGAPLLTRQSITAMHTPFIFAEEANIGGMIQQAAAQTAKSSGTTPPLALFRDNGYAFFLGTETFAGQRVVEHGGNTDGFTANLSLLPDLHSGVMVMTNNEHADYFIEAVRQHVLQLLSGTRTPLDTSANLQAQLKLLGVDNATRQAQLQAAQTYKASSADLQALAGDYTGLAGKSVTKVSVAQQRYLKLKTEIQGVKINLDLLPIGNNQFLSNSQPAVGNLFSFTSQGGKQTIALISAFGALPVGERTR